MITLVYSPYFGPRPYIDLAGRGGILMGEAPVGTQGLLDSLELYFGNKGEEVDSLDRLICYVKAMRKAVAEDSTLFFAESFRGDEIGTAKVILAWRDALMMALWKPEMDSTDKLYGLSSIENHFHSPGLADRWRFLLGRVADAAVTVPCDITIECRTSADTLEPCVRKVLETLQKKGMSVVFSSVTTGAAPEGTALRAVQDALLKGVDGDDKTKMALPDDGSFRHASFDFGYDAARWAALSAKDWRDAGTLLVNSRNAEMNGSLRVLGQPTLRSDIDSAPQSAQLFLLGLSLFRTPVDVRRLLSYLRVSPNPIGKLCLKKTNKEGAEYYKPLNQELTDILLGSGGFDGWKEAIEAAVYDKEGNTYTTSKRNEKLRLFQMWEKTDADGSIPKEALQSWLKYMRRWADGLAQVIDDDPGYAKLSTNCAAMELLLEDAPEKVDAERISHWAEGIFSTITMTVDIAESGAGESVPDFRDTMDSPEKVVWMGVCGADAATYPYPFLSPRECRLLDLPTREEFAAAAHRSLVESIARVKESLILVSYDCENGEALAEHPVMTELAARFKLPVVEKEALSGKESPSCTSGPVSVVHTSRKEYGLDPAVFEGLDKTVSEGGILPDRESSTSLEKLINYPFDYVLKYLLKFDSYGEEQLSDMSIVKGNVAHQYIQDLVEKGKKDIDKMQRIHTAEFEDGILSAVRQKGAILLPRENGLEWGKFKNILRISVDRLLELIRRNRYQIVGSEVNVLTDLPVIGPFEGRIDLLLQDTDGKYVIIDFKSSESSTYKHKMEERNIMQLILYKEAVQRLYGRVSVYGYWLLSQYTFLTESGSVLGDNVIPYHTDPAEVATLKDLFVQIKNSYTFRMEQIRQGKIEEGEMMQLADLAYYQNQGPKNLYPLAKDYKKPDLKGRPYGKENITLKGGLE